MKMANIGVRVVSQKYFHLKIKVVCENQIFPPFFLILESSWENISARVSSRQFFYVCPSEQFCLDREMLLLSRLAL